LKFDQDQSSVAAIPPNRLTTSANKPENERCKLAQREPINHTVVTTGA
jgi:hypothetical protein